MLVYQRVTFSFWSGIPRTHSPWFQASVTTWGPYSLVEGSSQLPLSWIAEKHGQLGSYILGPRYSRSPEIFKRFWEIPFTRRLWNKKHPVNEGFSIAMLYFRRIVMEQWKAHNKQNTVLRLTCGIVLAGGLWFLALSEQIDRCRQPDTLHFGSFR